MRFAANLSMMFCERPFPQRFAAAAAAGFDAVECQFPYALTPEAFAEALGRHRLEQVLFNLPPGDWEAGERGLACLPGREAEFEQGLERALAYAAAAQCPRLHAMSGVVAEGPAKADMRHLWLQRIGKAAHRAAEKGVTLLVEPINSHDMPGYFLDDFGLALELLRELDGPARLQFDIYHCARIHGDVVGWIRRAAPLIAHYQIAGVPGRHEPDVGELPLHEIFETMEAETPGLVVGCEYRPAGQTEAGLGWLKAL